MSNIKKHLVSISSHFTMRVSALAEMTQLDQIIMALQKPRGPWILTSK